MNCEKSRELFVDYLGEELPKTEVRGLQEHLKSCSGCRQELALLARTKSALRVGWPDESIPQSLTFEFATPSERGLWSHLLPSRLPRVVWASLGVTGCFLVCLMSLALLRAQIRLENGNFSLSFGQPIAPASAVVQGPVVTGAPQLRAEAIKALLDQSLKQFELNQNAKLQQVLQETKLEWETKRNADFARVGKELKYLESTQNVVWKETLLNNSNLEMLARNYVKAAPRETLQQ
jgi:putative zinc finger protein